MPRLRPSPCALLLAALAAPLGAQTTASLRVLLLDAGRRPRPRAEVQLESLDHARHLTLRSDDQGVAAVAGLLPGRYQIQGQALHLFADTRTEITLVGEAGSATVAVQAPPVEREGSSIAPQTRLEALDMERLPLAQKRYVEQSLLAPGITPSGKPEPVVLGSMLDANQYLVDGMPTNLGSTGRFGLNLSSEIIESQTLTTGGHKAEVGFASGGAFSLVTKSGTNTLQGTLFGTRIARNLNKRPEAGKANLPDERPTDGSSWGFSLGGPLAKDRLFFFAAFERQLPNLDFENVTTPGGRPHTRSQEEDRRYRFLKLTWFATAEHRLELSGFGDPVTQYRFDTAGDASLKDFQMVQRTRGGNSFTLKHAGPAGRFSWENTLGLHRSTFQWSPMNPEAGPNRAQLDGKESFGAYAEERLERIRNLSLRSELTGAFGAHQVKGGLQALDARFTVGYRRPSGGLSFLDRAAVTPVAGPKSSDIQAIKAGLLALNGSDYGYTAGASLATASPVSGQLLGGLSSYLYQRTLSDTAEYGHPLVSRTLGLFLQDDWEAGEGLVLSLGLRLDRAQIKGEDGRTLYRQNLLSPRLGLSWDPTKNGRTRLFAYWGRIYSPPTPGGLTAAGATTGGPAQEKQVWIPALQDWRSWQRTGTQGVANVALGDLRSPRTNLSQFGLEHMQSLPGLGIWTLEAVATHKRVRDLLDTYDPAWGYLPALSGPAQASAGKKIIANLPGLQRTFKGLDLTARRSFERGHRLQLSWSFGDLQGNSEVGNVASSTGRSTTFALIPSLREDYRLPQYTGPLNESVKHAIKAFGSARLPWEFELAGAFIRRSGLRYSPLVEVSKAYVLAPGASRGEGELPAVSSLDLSLARAWKLGRVSHRFALEVYNLLDRQPMTVIHSLDGALTPGNHQQPRVFQGQYRLSF